MPCGACYQELELVRDHASDLQAVCGGAEATTEKLANRGTKLSELDMMIQLLAEVTRSAGDLQKV